MAFKKQRYSGTCICGHSFEDHHLGMVANPEAYEIMGAYYAQECEYFGCNENGGLDSKGRPHCGHYQDKNDPEYAFSIRRKYEATIVRIVCGIRDWISSFFH
jgi:hypothetical protein